MSDYDLGTAHGKIKIDSDTRGAEEAARSTDAFNKKVRDLSSAASLFNAAANKIDAALNAMRRNYDDTDRSVNKLNRDVDGLSGGISAHASATRRASSSTKEWTGSLEGLHSRLLGINEVLALYGPAAVQVARMAKSFKDLGGSQNTMLNLGRSFFAVGGASTVFSVVRSRFLGMGKALGMAPVWQQQVVSMANSFRLLTFGVGLLTKYEVVGRGWTRAAQEMAKVSQGAALNMLKLGDGVEKAMRPILPAIEWVKRFNNNLDGIAGGAVKTVGGLALMRSGFAGLNRSFGIFGRNFQTGNYYLDMLVRGLKFVFLPGIILSSAAMQAFGLALRGTSNLVAGLWDGIKQLAGGMLALPGLFATIGAAAATGMVIFSNLKNQLKTIGAAKGDIDKINQAIAAMPPYLRPLGQAIADLTPKWKAFQDTLTSTFITGSADQLRSLANNLLPQVGAGSIQVANAFRLAKDNVVNFVTESKTISAMLAIFSNTAQIITTISSQIHLLGGGMRDLAVVGSGFIRDLAQDLLPRIAIGFNNWAKAAVDSGKALQWMKNSVTGVHDLFMGTLNLTKALYGLLTMFKSVGGGDNFLAKYAKDMDNFNKKVQASLNGGLLKKMGDDIRSWGTGKIHDLVDLFKSLEPAIKAAYGILQQMSGAFSTLLPILQAGVIAFGAMVQAFNAIGGGYIVGTIMTITTAFGWLMKAVMPIANIIKILVGALAFKSGAETIVLGLAGALEKLGPMGVKASGALLGAGDAITGFAGAAAAGLAIVIGAFVSYSASGKFVSDTNKVISDSAKKTAEDVAALQAAFADDKGVAGANVFSAEKKGIDDMMQRTNDLAAKAPGILEHIGQLFTSKSGNKQDSWNPFSETDAFNGAQKITDDAKGAKDAFDALGMSSAQLSQQIMGTTPGFDQTIQKLEDMGQNGSVAAEQLLEAKKSFDLAAASARDAGPAALLLAKGVQEIANAGGNASTQLDGLKTALTGLGLFKEDEYQAALNLAKAITDIGDAAAGVVDKTQPLANILDPNTGMLNAQAGANAANLYNAVKQISEAFLSLSTSDPGKAAGFIPQMTDQLENLRQQFGLDKAAFDKFIASMGIDPKIVNILLQLTGADQVHQDIIKTLATMQANVGNGIKVPVSIGDPKQAAAISQQINSLFGGKPATTSDNGNVYASPGINQNEIDAIAKKYGINLGGVAPPPGVGASPVPAGGMPAPVAPIPAPPVAPKKGEPGYVAPPEAPKAPTLPKGFAGLGIPAPQMPGAAPVAAAPAPVAPTPQQATLATIMAPPAAPAAPTTPQSPSLNIAVSGMDQLAKAQDAVNGAATAITKAWQGMTQSIAKGFGDAMTAINTFVNNAINTLNRAGDRAKQSGVAFGMDFAAGIRSPASLKAISDAAIAAADTASKKMPGSPAKEGPLSGQGWSGIAGKAFSDDFAGGISSGVSNISSSAKDAAAAAKIVFGGLTKGVPDSSNFLKQFSDLTTLAGNFQRVFSQAYNTGSTFLSAMSDPFKTGGFFGRALPYARDPKVTDAQLAQNRQKGDTGIGGDLTGGAASLAGVQAPSKEQIAAAIVGEAQKRGYDRNTAIGALSAGLHESGLNSTITNASDHKGIFQEDAAKPGRDTAQGQIGWFFDQLDQMGGPGSTSLKSDPLDTIASQIEKGGYTGAALAQHTPDAAKLYDQVLGQAGNVGVGPDAAFAGAQGYADNPASRAKEATGGQNVEQGVNAAGIAPLYATSGPNAYQLPQWMNDLAAKFGLKASTYSSGGSLHQMGFAADFMGDPKMMEAFAQYIRQNLSGQTLQLIHQGQSGQKYGIAAGQEVGPGTSQPQYYAGNWQEEGSMVHWATDVAPILGQGNANAASGQNDAVLNQLRANNSSLDQAIKIGQNPTSTDQDVASSLQTIKQASISANQGNTPESKQNAQALDSVASSISSQRGMAESKDPISSASGVISGASQIAGDVIGDINDTIQAIGATKNTADILVRGIANTNDVMKIIDNTQQWISTIAQYAQTVGDVANEVAQVANAASEGEPGGGSISGVAGIIGGVASAISGGLQGVNEAIDIAQELYQIWGSYYGNFLGFLTGGNNSLQGNVQYLLDQNTNQLIAYSTDNPMVKATHPVPGQLTNPGANNQAIGQLNYYAGPGTDPRQATRDMMFQVKAAGYAGATSA